MVGALTAMEESMTNVCGCLSSLCMQKGSLVRDMAVHML